MIAPSGNKNDEKDSLGESDNKCRVWARTRRQLVLRVVWTMPMR